MQAILVFFTFSLEFKVSGLVLNYGISVHIFSVFVKNSVEYNSSSTPSGYDVFGMNKRFDTVRSQLDMGGNPNHTYPYAVGEITAIRPRPLRGVKIRD